MARASVAITAEDKMSPGLLKARKNMMQFSQATQEMGKMIRSALGIAGAAGAIGIAAVGVKKLGNAFASAFKDFSEAERKYKQLRIALGDSSEYEKVVQNIKSLSRETVSSKDQLESMVAQLAGLGKSADEIDQISSAAVYLSNVTGKDLNSSMNALLGTFNGQARELQKLVPEIKGMTKEELASGAAVDLVRTKFESLSKAMAEADNSQHITNISNNLGDMKQSIGDLISFSLTPALSALDAWSTSAVDRLDGAIQRIKVVLGNLPEVAGAALSVVGGILDRFLSVDGFMSYLRTVYDGLSRVLVSALQGLGNMAIRISELVVRVGESALKAVGNYAMYWITSIADRLGINLSEVINSIGRWLLDSQIGRYVDRVITTAVNGVRLVGATIRNIPDIMRIVLSSVTDMVRQVLSGLPTAFREIFLGVLDFIPTIGLSLKNSLLQSVQDAINNLGSKLQSTWVGKLFGVGSGMAEISFNIDRASEDEYRASAQRHFGAAVQAVDISTEFRDMVAEIDRLLAPTFEEFVANSSESIGQTMATWTAKSSDEYYRAAKESFSDIGTFLKDWGADFLGGVGDDWKELSGSVAAIFKDVYGEDVDRFLAWFRPFMEEKLSGKSVFPASGTNAPSAGGSPGSRSVDMEKSNWEKFQQDAFGQFTSKMGQAGDLAENLSSNMSQMGPVFGAVATALEYVLDGLSEVVGPVLDQIVEFGIEPLRELGRVVGRLLVPVLEMVVPVLGQIADLSISLFDALGQAFMPVIRMVNSSLSPMLMQISQALRAAGPVLEVFAKMIMTVSGTFEFIGQSMMHWVAKVANWFAGLSLLGWHPFGGLRMNDPGSPGSYDSFIRDRWGSVQSSFASASSISATSTGTSIASAGYQGATSVTINIYQQSPVVGDGGMRQFAAMIRSEFDTLDYYGVTV